MSFKVLLVKIQWSKNRQGMGWVQGGGHNVTDRVKRYFGIPEAADSSEEEMRLKVSERYVREQSKLIIVQENNTWTLSWSRYSAKLISWRMWYLQAIIRKTRQLSRIYGQLHPMSDANILHVLKKSVKIA